MPPVRASWENDNRVYISWRWANLALNNITIAPLCTPTRHCRSRQYNPIKTMTQCDTLPAVRVFILLLLMPNLLCDRLATWIHSTNTEHPCGPKISQCFLVIAISFTGWEDLWIVVSDLCNGDSWCFHQAWLTMKKWCSITETAIRIEWIIERVMGFLDNLPMTC